MLKRKLTACLLVIALVCLQASHLFVSVGYAQTDTQNYLTFKYDRFNSDGRLKMNGNSAIAGNVLKLTPSAESRWGTVFNNNRISLSNSKSFSTYFEFNMNSGSGLYVNGKQWTWADGLVFTVQTTSNGAGGAGLGLGYSGIGKSVGVEFDTFRNGPDIGNLGDPAGLGANASDSIYTNHAAVDINGNVNHLAQKEATQANGFVGDYRNLDNTPDIRMRKNTATQHAWIDYNGEDKTLEVRMSNSDRRPSGYVLKKTNLDLTNILQSDDVYVGFTASTGSAWQEHNITKWYFSNTYSPIDVGSQTYLEAPKSVSFTPVLEADRRVKLDISTLAVNGTPAGNIPLTIKVDNPNVRIVEDHVTTGIDGKAYTYLASDKQVTTMVRIEAPGGVYTEKMVTIPAYVNPKLNMDGTGLTESPNNDGSIAGQKTITITGGTFSSNISGNDLKINNLPSGLTPVVVRSDDGKSITLSFDGKASKHSEEFSTNNVSVVVGKNAVNGATMDLSTPSFAIQFKDPARIRVTETEVNEAVEENFQTGKIDGVLQVRIENGSFSPAITNQDVELNPLPEGLAPMVTYVDDQNIRVSFDGSAVQNDNSNDVMSSLQVKADGLLGSNGAPLSSNTFKINFNDPDPYIVMQGQDIRESDNNDGSITDVIEGQLKYGTFHDLTKDDVTVHGLPDGLSIHDITVSGDMLTVSLTGNALSHANNNSIYDAYLSVPSGKVTSSKEQTEDPVAYSVDPVEPAEVVSNSFAILFRDPPPAIEVNPGLITDEPGSKLTVTLKNGIFTEDVQDGSKEGITVNNLPEGMDFVVDRINDTTLELTFTGTPAGKTEASKYASVTIAADKIATTEGPASNDVTSNTFNLDIPSDKTIVELDRDTVEIGYQEGDSKDSVTQDVILPTGALHGSTVTWTSSNPSVIDLSGNVNRPSEEDGNQTVKLTAEIICGIEKVIKTFDLTVIARPMTDQEAVNLDETVLDIGYHEGEDKDHVLNDVVLPKQGDHGTDITWTSEPEGYVDPVTGKVKRPASGQGDQTIILKATIKKGDTTKTKEFTLIVKAEAPAPGNGQGGGTGGGTGGSNPTPTPTPQPETETITLNVQVGKGSQFENAAKTTITRTTLPDKTKKDTVNYTQSQAEETVKMAQANGSTTARLFIPDVKDEVSSTDVNISKAAIEKLVGAGLDLAIYTENAQIHLPAESLKGLTKDLYFRVVPIKKEDERKQVEARAKQEKVVREVLGSGNIYVVGRPMTIETNMSSRAVTIMLPLEPSAIPSGAAEREKFMSNLAVFIEHSDGERVLVKPEIGTYDEDRMGLSFSITKFSTFTIVNIDNLAQYLKDHGQSLGQAGTIGSGASADDAEGSHRAYIKGYPDGTFKPEKSLTRAEMATMLSRIGTGKAGILNPVDYPDMTATHWAKDAVTEMTKTGLMKGFPDGRFGPEQSITRAEMAAIVTRWLGLAEAAGTPAAIDVKDIQGHWAEKDLKLVIQAGLMKGMPDGTFRPDKPLTRAEAVTVLNRILKRGPLEGMNVPAWKDAPSNHWAYGDIEEASLDHGFTRTAAGSERIAE
ncbi:immunoglobulin-like domain-containing protein [Paenibacillus sp. SAF-054]|uniref:immunoglobulin-like domain-containing protein n=1 Tax=Paenibacillus sp. SAF-054 TaxID=3436863 RepID=UPI003F7EE8CA